MRILLTGGSGMVGQNLLQHPKIQNFEVLSPSRSECNLLSYESVIKYIGWFKPEMVIHAAGKVGGIKANQSDPLSFLVENMDMGRNVILASRELGITNLLNLGSSCMYPRGHVEPMDEDLILKGELEPTNEGYALAKAVCLRLCDYISRDSTVFNYKTLIPCNLYGPYDKFDFHNAHLIPAIIAKVHNAINNSLPAIEIWGDGLARREFMYAGDLADAIMKAVEDFDSLPSTMNVGVGLDYSINEYYSMISDVLGYKGTFTHDTSKPSGMIRKLVSIKKQQSWGWMPTTQLRSGISKTYHSYLKSIHDEN